MQSPIGARRARRARRLYPQSLSVAKSIGPCWGSSIKAKKRSSTNMAISNPRRGICSDHTLLVWTAPCTALPDAGKSVTPPGRLLADPKRSMERAGVELQAARSHMPAGAGGVSDRQCEPRAAKGALTWLYAQYRLIQHTGSMAAMANRRHRRQRTGWCESTIEATSHFERSRHRRHRRLR